MYVGSIPTGRVLALNTKTGATDVVVPQREGRAAIGLKHHRGRLLVAGGPTGRAFVYDADTGEDVRDVALADAPTFVNDVTITGDLQYDDDPNNIEVKGIAALPNGRTLYVVQNRLNKIAVVRLERDLSQGEIVREITQPAFDVPTTIARRGSFLYAPNSRFGIPPPPDNDYAVVRVRATPPAARASARPPAPTGV